MSRPSFILSTTDVAETSDRYPNSDELLGHGRAIGRAAGLERIGVHVVRLAPGHRSSWPHAEEKEEEFVYVLRGNVDAWIDGSLHPMQAGDFAAFPAGTGICHTFLNDGATEAVLLIGGEASKPGNRIFYPLHPHRQSELPDDQWWADIPLHPQGSHDGKPRLPPAPASSSRAAGSRPVREVMTADPCVVSPDDTVERAWSVMKDEGCRHVPVVEHGALVGILSTNDVGRLGSTEPSLMARRVRDAMTKNPHTARPDEAIESAAAQMGIHKVNCLPVVSEGKLVGIVTTYDLLDALVRRIATDHAE
jgi:uncharacterized cupin superfamily protein/CBS domain-containing protein